MKTKYPLEACTFGSSKAAITLADILSEHANDNLTSKVSKYIGDHNEMLRELSHIPCPSIRLNLINMIGDRVKNTELKWPVRVASYTKNVVQSQVKYYRELDETIVKAEVARIARLRSARELFK